MAPYTPPPWEGPPKLTPTQPNIYLLPPSLQSRRQNLQSVPQNIQLITPHLQYESPRHQLKYQKIELAPPNLQVPPADLQLPPPNLMLPPPTLNMIPPNIQLPIPDLKLPPPTLKISPPNLKVPPPNHKMSLPNIKVPPPTCTVSPLNLKMPTPKCEMSPPNFNMPSPTHKMSPPTLQMAPTNLKVPPPILNVPPPNLNETLPATLQMPPPNLQLPPPNLQLPPANFQLPPPNPSPSFHISPIILPNCSQPPPTVMTTSDSRRVVSVPFQQLYDPIRIQTICGDTEQNANRKKTHPYSQVKINNGLESKWNEHVDSQSRISRSDWRYKHLSQSVASDGVRSSYKRKRSDDRSYKEPRASSFERGWNGDGGSRSCNERTCYDDTISPLSVFDTSSDENSNIVQKTPKEEKENKYPEEGKEGALSRSSQAQVYYDAAEAGGGGGAGRAVRGTRQLTELCDRFKGELLLRASSQREELPPRDDARMPRHDSESSSESEASEEMFIHDPASSLEELRRKMSHPRRLHRDIWYNEEGESNTGPTCLCSADARREGVHHYMYEGEPKFPRCRPETNNIDKLFYYRVTVSPTTNFLMKTPTVITHDRRDYIFTGFSLISHYELKQLPPCKIIRCKIEHTIHYLKGEAPANFTIRELDLFHSYLFKELLQLMDFNDKATDETCSQFHLLPRFVAQTPGGCEVLSMCEVMKYLLNSTIPVLEYNRKHPEDCCRETLLWNPDKKPACIRCDLLDPDELHPAAADENAPPLYPTIVHFGTRPVQLCFSLNKEYQEAWKLSQSYYHKLTNMAKPTERDRRLLQKALQRLNKAKCSSTLRRDFTAAVSSEGFYTTGLMSDIVQHAILIPQLTHHLRFYKSLESLESKLCYKFTQPSLLRFALTHPSYREHGTNLDHIRNTISNCALSRPTYGDASDAVCGLRRRGIMNLARKMEVRNADAETTSGKNYERLEFLGDAVLQFLTSYHLLLMFPDVDEGELSTRRMAIVQNSNLAIVGKELGLDKYFLIWHNIDNSEQEFMMSRATSNCVEAVLAAVYLDGGLQAADKTLAEMIWRDLSIRETWMKELKHPLVCEEPLGDRHYIPLYSSLQKLVLFEESINLQFKHIRLLARAFADGTQRESYLTLGSGQRLEFFGDAVLELVVSDKLFRRFPAHTEGQLTLLRASLVCNDRLAVVFDDLAMGNYTITSIPESRPYCLKQKADVVEAFFGAIYLDKGMKYCESFCEVVLMHHLESILENQSWNDPKSKLQHCCIALRTIDGEPEMPVYRLLESRGASHARKYVVAVYLRGERLATGTGSSIRRSEAAAAMAALTDRPELFPLLDRHGRIRIQRPMTRVQSSETNKSTKPTPCTSCIDQEPHGISHKLHASQQEPPISCQESHVSSQEHQISGQERHVSTQELHARIQEPNISSQEPYVSSEESHASSQETYVSSQEHQLSSKKPDISSQENQIGNQKTETNSESEDSLDDIVVTTWITDMQHLKEMMIQNKTYDRLIAKKNNCLDDYDD